MTQRRPLRRRFALIPFQYKRWLLSGKPGALIYLEAKRVESLWEQYGDGICERVARRRPFCRPPNFWRFDCTRSPKLPGQSSFDYLVAHPHLLFDFEQRQLERQGQRLDRLRLRPS